MKSKSAALLSPFILLALLLVMELTYTDCYGRNFIFDINTPPEIVGTVNFIGNAALFIGGLGLAISLLLKLLGKPFAVVSAISVISLVHYVVWFFGVMLMSCSVGISGGVAGFEYGPIGKFAFVLGLL